MAAIAQSPKPLVYKTIWKVFPAPLAVPPILLAAQPNLLALPSRFAKVRSPYGNTRSRDFHIRQERFRMPSRWLVARNDASEVFATRLAMTFGPSYSQRLSIRSLLQMPIRKRLWPAPAPGPIPPAYYKNALRILCRHHVRRRLPHSSASVCRARRCLYGGA